MALGFLVSLFVLTPFAATSVLLSAATLLFAWHISNQVKSLAAFTRARVRGAALVTRKLHLPKDAEDVVGFNFETQGAATAEGDIRIKLAESNYPSFSGSLDSDRIIHVECDPSASAAWVLDDKAASGPEGGWLALSTDLKEASPGQLQHLHAAFAAIAGTTASEALLQDDATGRAAVARAISDPSGPARALAPLAQYVLLADIVPALVGLPRSEIVGKALSDLATRPGPDRADQCTAYQIIRNATGGQDLAFKEVHTRLDIDGLRFRYPPDTVLDFAPCTVIEYVHVPSRHATLVVAKHPVAQVLKISVASTDSLQDWKENLDVEVVFPGGDDKYGYHGGTYKDALALLPTLKRALRTHRGHALHFAGHSLGAMTQEVLLSLLLQDEEGLLNGRDVYGVFAGGTAALSKDAADALHQTSAVNLSIARLYCQYDAIPPLLVRTGVTFAWRTVTIFGREVRYPRRTRLYFSAGFIGTLKTFLPLRCADMAKFARFDDARHVEVVPYSNQLKTYTSWTAFPWFLFFHHTAFYYHFCDRGALPA